MDDLRLGRALRAIRIRRGLRQRDIAAAAGLSDVTVSRIERGHIAELQVRTLRAVAGVLEVRVELVPRWRGGDMDRVLSGRHASLGGTVIRDLIAAGWEVRPEVSFSVYGERGVIDLLAWHPSRMALLVIELKTEIVDAGELLGTLDRKRRLAPRIARDLGWYPVSVSACLILVESATNRRRAREFASTLRAALPMDGRRFRGWLRDPGTAVGAVAFWSDRLRGTTSTNLAPTRRVRQGPGSAPGPTSSVSRAGSARLSAASARPGRKVRSSRPGGSI